MRGVVVHHHRFRVGGPQASQHPPCRPPWARWRTRDRARAAPPYCPRADDPLLASLLAAVDAAPADVPLRLHVAELLAGRDRLPEALPRCTATLQHAPGIPPAPDRSTRAALGACVAVFAAVAVTGLAGPRVLVRPTLLLLAAVAVAVGWSRRRRR